MDAKIERQKLTDRIWANSTDNEYQLCIHKAIADKIGITPAIFLSALIKIDSESYNGRSGDAFSCQQELIKEWCWQSFDVQRKSMKILKAHDLLEVNRKGIPAKNFYKINYSEILKITNGMV